MRSSLLPYLSCLLLCLPQFSGFAHAEDPSPPDPPEEGAGEGESLWNYIEGAPARQQDVQATAELAAERYAELGFMGLIGTEAPVEYYLDPVDATNLDPLQLDKINPAEFDIPIVVNDMVKKWMVYFLGNGRKYYSRYLERSTHWTPMMYEQIDARGLPRDLVYLSMIESGFTTSAYSYASAVGLWQFMSYTGKDYGLRIDWWVDERRDPVKSTDAALRLLSNLHKQFGDWYLAWASYNGGPGRVGGAVKKVGSTDFWKIVAADVLHPETENYVPKLLAAAIIGKHPERYGFVGLKYQSAFEYDRIEVPASVSVEVLARCASMTQEEFLDYNPGVLRFALPPDPEIQTVQIKKGGKKAFEVAFAKIPPQERISFARHTVKRGETLSTIAAKYGVTTDDIARMNRISSKTKIYTGMELVVPTNGQVMASTVPAASTAAPAAPKTSGGSSSTAAKPATVTYHTVKSGETLSGIADKYNVTTDQLKSWNGISNANSIMVGQKLKVSSGGSSSSSSSSSSAPKPPAPTYYTVQSGDTLSGIATKYGTTIDQLKAWNKLSSSTIQPGQKLVVKGGTSSAPSTSSTAASSSGWISYTVKRGDTLGGIADRYNCTVTELKSWNKLSSSTIYPGQKLKIKK